jgi:hypothetical protein
MSPARIISPLGQPPTLQISGSVAASENSLLT